MNFLLTYVGLKMMFEDAYLIQKIWTSYANFLVRLEV